MNFESISEKIQGVENCLESIKDQIKNFENQEKNKKTTSDYMGAANRMKTIHSCFKNGMSPMEIADYMHDELGGSLFDNYCFVNSIVWKEREKLKYARNFLVNTLFANGFKKAEISQIANISPQRCGQIIKQSHF